MTILITTHEAKVYYLECSSNNSKGIVGMLQRKWADFIGLSGFLSNPSIIGVHLR